MEGMPMSADDDDRQRLRDEDEEEYVPAVFAETIDEAEQYAQIFRDHDIDAIVDDEYEDPDEDDEADLRQAVAVLVPESARDEAGALLDELEEAEVLILDDDEEFEDEDDEEDELIETDGADSLGFDDEEEDPLEEEDED
jgi:hypothetical protein